MSLDSTDLAVITRLKAAGIPVIVVVVSGRPLDIASQLGGWNAALAAWLPGTEGAGVADVLFGDYNPTGKLPMTWMSSVSQQPINDGDGKAPLFPLGFGLSYTGTPTTTDPYAVVQAESATGNTGVQFQATTDTGGGQNAGFIGNGDNLFYDNVAFGTTSAARVSTRVASGATSGGTLTYRLDSATGPVVGTVTIAPTGGWQTWQTVTANVTGATGTHRLYLTFSRPTTGDFANVNWFQFAH
jgi:beta-glucosidase